MKNLKRSQLTTSALFDRIDARESDYLYINSSQIPDTGNGLYTAIPIWKDEIICLFKGEILSTNEANERAQGGFYKYFVNMLDGSTMDSMHVKCFAKYANDAQGYVKTKFALNAIITIDDKSNVCLVAKSDIKAGEEIFCSYGKKILEKHNLN